MSANCETVKLGRVRGTQLGMGTSPTPATTAVTNPAIPAAKRPGGYSFVFEKDR